jgi:hypothetical protein
MYESRYYLPLGRTRVRKGNRLSGRSRFRVVFEFVMGLDVPRIAKSSNLAILGMRRNEQGKRIRAYFRKLSRARGQRSRERGRKRYYSTPISSAARQASSAAAFDFALAIWVTRITSRLGVRVM